ncbi:MAG: acyl-CoA thioesterase [Firmicutes bacterium]|nr:acyl-CoA thioesterase [Bacillota bacterium]
MKPKPYKRKVYYYETDAIGIVHHSNFIRWLEEGRLNFFEQMGIFYEDLEKSGIAIILTNVTCDYKKMFKFNEEFEIHIKIKSISHAKFTLSYKIKNKDQVYATAETTHCGVQNNKLISLKKTLPEIYLAMENLIE